jgi:release factor glutamine methyltransferase
MTISELYTHIKNSLTAQFPDPTERGIVSRRIVGGLAGVNYNDCILHPDRRIEIDNTAVNNVIKRISSHEPLEYVFNSAQFIDIELYTNSNVLIPRPETEELALKILDDLRMRRGQGGGAASPSESDSLSLLDIGTGSGCIPVYLAKNFPICNYYAVDVSDAALATAQGNAKRHGCNIHFIKADILNSHDCGELESLQVDIIVSNPPYVLESEKAQMKPNVLDYEPELALFVPDGEPLWL